MKNKTKLTFILLIFCCSCIEEYPIDVFAYENYLVVDGMITNDPGPYTIRLSRSANISEPSFIPEVNAEVKILDNEGLTEILIPVAEGVYETSPDGIVGEAGKSYQLQVRLEDGSFYQTAFSELMIPVEIESLTGIIETKPTDDINVTLEGLQFYLSTVPASSDTNYFLWRLNETYEYHSDFTIDYIFNGSIQPYPYPDSVYTCWRTDEIDQIYCYSTIDQVNPFIKDLPLNYVSTQTKKLSVRYSLLTTQYTIDGAAYLFWKNVKDQLTDDEFLFSHQPFQVRGNLKNTYNMEEPVMGYFTVAGVSQKRIFKNRPDLEFTYDECFADIDLRILGYTPPNLWPLYLVDTPDGKAYAPKTCFDCRMHDGTLTKPEFWIDE
jgi:Domain of unknown function (DUF4249)